MTRQVSQTEIYAAQVLGWSQYRAGSDYLSKRMLPDGRCVYLMPMYLGNVRLAIGMPGQPYLDDAWCYQHAQADDGWRAALGWDGEEEPEGWYRHPQSGRRRTAGDPSREHVRA